MKRIFLKCIFTFIITSSICSAQTEKGSKLIGGSFSFQRRISEAGTNYSSYTIGFYSKVGFFVADNFALGISLPLSYGHFKSDDTKTIILALG